MIGLILAAGDNIRIAEHLDIPSKVLIPIGGRSLILRNMDLLSKVVEGFIIVVGKAEDHIKVEISGSEYCERTIFIKQEEATGTLDAVRSAFPYIHDDVFLVLGDELLINNRINDMALNFETSGIDISVGVIIDSDDSDIRDAYTVHYMDGFIDEFVEKPDIIFNRDRGTGFYLIRNKVLKLLTEIDAGKKDIIDLFNHALGKGFTATSFEVAMDEYNINTIERLKKAEKAFENWKK